MTLASVVRRLHARKPLVSLTLDELRALDGWIHARMVQLAAELAAPEPTSVGLDRRLRGRVTLQLERVRCGKPGCHCADGPGHGPYWYAYDWHNGRLRKRYVGRELPRRARRR